MKMSMADDFVDAWRRMQIEYPGRQVEIDGGHPLRIFYGSNQLGQLIFFVISDTKPGLVSLSDAVVIERGIRTIDGRWTLSLTLRDGRFMDEFMRLGDDLVDNSRAGGNESHALQIMVRTVDEWRAFLSYGPNQHLSLPAIRGLLGELWFGFFRLAESVPPPTVVRAWTGPFASPQDFNLPTGQTYEVKTIYPDAKSVQISSAEQLDPGLRSLELVVVTLLETCRSDDDALSLPTAVQLIETMLGERDAGELRMRLKALGVDVTDSYYDDFWFRVGSCITYRVDAEFPSIRRTSLNLAISDVRYEIALSAIADFKSSTWIIDNHIR